jgi:hypothetical protein
MALYYYRGIDFTKNYFCKYINSVFLANEKGNLDFLDGTKKLEFSSRPFAVKVGAWADRKLPVVLVGAATGSFAYMSVNKDMIDSPVEGSTPSATVYDYYGGEIRLRMDLTVMATQMAERDKIVDITGIYLSHPMAKTYFQKHNIILPEAPTISGEAEVDVPGIDRPVYRTSMSMPATGVWQDRQAAGVALIDIVSDIVAEIDVDF